MTWLAVGLVLGLLVAFVGRRVWRLGRRLYLGDISLKGTEYSVRYRENGVVRVLYTCGHLWAVKNVYHNPALPSGTAVEFWQGDACRGRRVVA